MRDIVCLVHPGRLISIVSTTPAQSQPAPVRHPAPPHTSQQPPVTQPTVQTTAQPPIPPRTPNTIAILSKQDQYWKLRKDLLLLVENIKLTNVFLYNIKGYNRRGELSKL